MDNRINKTNTGSKSKTPYHPIVLVVKRYLGLAINAMARRHVQAVDS
jgi:hypothetical protein